MKIIIQIVGLIGLSWILFGCASTSQQESEIPWNRPATWENSTHDIGPTIKY